MNFNSGNSHDESKSELDNLGKYYFVPQPVESKDKNTILKSLELLEEAISKYKDLINILEQKLLKENNPIIISRRQIVLNKIRGKQLQALSEFKKNYEKLTQLNKAALKVKISLDVNKRISQTVLEKTLEEKGFVNVDYYTLKRLAQSDQVTYKNLLHTNGYLRYIATILCFIVIVYVIGSFGYISFQVILYVVFSLILLGICILLYTYYIHLNDDSLSVYEKNFPNTGAGISLPTVNNSCVSDSEDRWDTFFDKINM